MSDLNINNIGNDISNYLYVSEDNPKLQYLYFLGENYQNQKETNTIFNYKLVTSYKHIVDITSKFIKELNTQKDVTSYYIIFAYLLWNGYLSQNNKYIYSKENLLDISGFFGIDIITGKGNCKSISEFFNDILKKSGFNSTFLVNSFNNMYRDYIVDITQRIKTGPITKKVSFTSSTYLDPIGTHSSILVKENNNYYILDATNLAVYKTDNLLNASLYNGLGTCQIKPWGFIVYENLKQDDVQNIINAIRSQNISSFMTHEEIKEKSENALLVCRKNKALILDFHKSIQKDINNIYNNI